MRFVHFADDTTVFASDSDNNVHTTVNRELVGVDNWLKANRLSLNVSKTSYMIIFKEKNAIDISIRDSILTKVSTVKFLGVTLDENLTFNYQVKKRHYPARGGVGRVTDCGVRGLGFKSPGSILILEQKPVLYHEWSGMVGTYALYR